MGALKTKRQNKWPQRCSLDLRKYIHKQRRMNDRHADPKERLLLEATGEVLLFLSVSAEKEQSKGLVSYSSKKALEKEQADKTAVDPTRASSGASC